MGKRLDGRLQALERKQRGQDDDPVVLIERLFGDSSEPPPELVEEARRRARQRGLAFGVVGRADHGAGDWVIWEH